MESGYRQAVGRVRRLDYRNQSKVRRNRREDRTGQKQEKVN